MEGLCNVVETIIQDGQATCNRRWTASDVLLGLLGRPALEPIKEAPSPKLKLEEVGQSFGAVKEKIQGVNQLTLQEIMNWIETPNSAMVRIHVYLAEWKKVKKREITSQILSAEMHFDQAKY